jgi:hypothetical protein
VKVFLSALHGTLSHSLPTTNIRIAYNFVDAGLPSIAVALDQKNAAQSTLMSSSFYTPPQPVLPSITCLSSTMLYLCLILASVSHLPQRTHDPRTRSENSNSPIISDVQVLYVLAHSTSLPYSMSDILFVVGGSQVRFLLSKLNPSTTHMSVTVYCSILAAGAGHHPLHIHRRLLHNTFIYVYWKYLQSR